MKRLYLSFFLTFFTCMWGLTQNVNVTFSVDMSNETVDSAGVFLAGSFNSFANEPMTDNGDGTWWATIEITAGDTIDYKYKNGEDGWEDITDTDCTTGAFGNNRLNTIPAVDTTFGTVCFGSCSACPSLGVNITFTVNMSNETVDAEGVFLAGSFNGFTNEAMTDNGDNTWSLTKELTADEEVTYKFKNGPDGWENIPGVVCTDGSFGNDRLLLVPFEDATEAYCFGSCFACDEVAITFNVDMQLQSVDPEGVFIAGSFNNFTNEPMEDNLDGTWFATLGMTPGDTIEYKFKNGPDGWEEISDTTCTTGGFGNNRELIIPADDTNLGLVCFADCDECVVLSDVDITFQVDMSFETVDPGGVFLAGTFNSFGDTAMIDQGNGIWALTLNLPVEDTIEYKYKNGLQGWENIGDTTCTTGAFGNNRVNVIPLIQTVFDLVCFGSCGLCFDPTALTSTSIMNSCINTDGTFTIVFDEAQNCSTAVGDLAGMAEAGFHSGANEWATVIDWNDATAMNATNDGSDVFSVTIDPGTYYSLDPDSIASIWMVFNQGPAVPGTPWGSEGKDADLDGDGSCDDLRLFIDQMATCDPSSTIDRELETNLLAVPNPFDNKTVISFSNPNNLAYKVTLFDLAGKQIRTFNNVDGTSLSVDRNDMPPGMYFLNFRDEEGKIATLKLVAK